MAAESNSFRIGDKFASYELLFEKIKEYEGNNYIKLWKRDAKTVSAAKKRMDRELSNSIKYYSITFACIHGGRKYQGRGTGKRMTKTFRKDCPFELSLHAAEDGSTLVVKTFNEEHNHEVSKVLVDSSKTILDLKKEILSVSNEFCEDKRNVTNADTLRLYFMKDYELCNRYCIIDILYDGAIVSTSRSFHSDQQLVTTNNNFRSPNLPYSMLSSFYTLPFSNIGMQSFQPVNNFGMMPSSQFSSNISNSVTPHLTLPPAHLDTTHSPEIDTHNSEESAPLSKYKKKIEQYTSCNSIKLKKLNSDKADDVSKVKGKKTKAKKTTQKSDKEPEDNSDNKSKKYKPSHTSASVTFSEKPLPLSSHINWVDTDEEDTHQEDDRNTERKKKTSSNSLSSCSLKVADDEDNEELIEKNIEKRNSKETAVVSSSSKSLSTSIDWHSTDDEENATRNTTNVTATSTAVNFSSSIEWSEPSDDNSSSNTTKMKMSDSDKATSIVVTRSTVAKSKPNAESYDFKSAAISPFFKKAIPASSAEVRRSPIKQLKKGNDKLTNTNSRTSSNTNSSTNIKTTQQNVSSTSSNDDSDSEVDLKNTQPLQALAVDANVNNTKRMKRKGKTTSGNAKIQKLMNSNL